MTNYQVAKKRPAVQARTSAPKTKRLFGILLAFVIGYLTAWLYAPSTFMHWVSVALAPHDTKAVLTAKAPELPKPKFEFYTLLTQEKSMNQVPMQKQTPRAVEQVAKEDKREVKPLDVEKQVYLLQLASFQRKSDAEQMKAELTMRGLDVKIKAAIQNGQAWHRVVIGPFSSRLAAEKTQQAVTNSEHISSIIIRMDA